ncbi:MAG: energy transducer TonB [Flavobacteriales bacterium]|nr:energy transducer TonB [Flavobacteriales bacterium]
MFRGLLLVITIGLGWQLLAFTGNLVVTSDSLVEIASDTTDKPMAAPEDSVFVNPEEPAQFPGGMDAWMRFLFAQMVYPPEAMDDGVQGTIWVEFTVLTTGKLDNIHIKKSVEKGAPLEKEALRVVNLSPDWTPGKFNGVPVNMPMVVPIKFVLK